MTSIGTSKVLILATDGFEQSELLEPRRILTEAGATVHLAAPGRDPIQGMKHHEKGETITPDMLLSEVDIDEYDALILPGGVANPDALRMEGRAIEIVQDFADSGKPIAAICHGPWILAEANVIAGVTVTSWPSIRTDLRNAGADVVDQEVAVDGNIITSRKPEDIEAFTRALIKAVVERETAAAE